MRLMISRNIFLKNQKRETNQIDLIRCDSILEYLSWTLAHLQLDELHLHES
jgi:hypothetical protein